MHPLRMALVGYGRFGRIHALRARTHGAFELACVMDPDAAARRAAQADGLHAVASLHELPDGICAASVVAPAQAHAALSIALMQRGVHVLVEKPFAPSVADIEAMLAAQHGTGRLLCTAHIERFNASLHKGALPRRPTQLHFTRTCRAPLSAEAAVMDLMVHDLDLAALVLGLAHDADCDVFSVRVRQRTVQAHIVLGGHPVRLQATHAAHRSGACMGWRSGRHELGLNLSSPAPPGASDALTRQYSAWQRTLQGEATELASALDGAVAARRALAIAAKL